jgi:DNA-binding transcriptional LysR family regulator
MNKNLQKYQAFLAAAELKNITRAARHLNYAQSSVSKMIADLEKEWGFPLMTRSKKGVVLTPDGKTILPKVQRLVSDMQDIDKTVQQIQGLETGLIRIGVFASIAEHLLPPVIHAFQEEHPGIHFELLMGDYEEISRWAESGRIDFGFSRLPAPADLDAIPLLHDDFMGIVPETHPLAEKEILTPEDFEGEPFLLLENQGQAEVAEWLEKCQITPDIRFTTWDDYAIMSMVECGQGLALLPSLILQRIPYHIAIHPLSNPCSREIGLIMRDRKALSRAAQAFINQLICDGLSDLRH